MHTRSKRYLRRHRARLRAQRRVSLKPLKPFPCEDRLARQIAVGMNKRWLEIAGHPRALDLNSNRTLP
jgi:hypothetical protein